jgi:two-component system sensor histidine kinase DegS
MSALRLDHARSSMPREADVREDERRRLARELHDGPAQALAGALFGVDLALSAFDRTPATAREELVAARGLVRDALDDVRALMAGLRPRQLDLHGLVVALKTLSATPPLWGTEVSVATRGIAEGDRLPADIELSLFRIAQEAVSNARRHGAAGHVTVSLLVDSAQAALTIADDGQGWMGDLAESGAGRGEGLPGMRERVRLLGGSLRVESEPGRGTRVSVVAPLLGSDVDRGEETR